MSPVALRARSVPSRIRRRKTTPQAKPPIRGFSLSFVYPSFSAWGAGGRVQLARGPLLAHAAKGNGPRKGRLRTGVRSQKVFLAPGNEAATGLWQKPLLRKRAGIIPSR